MCGLDVAIDESLVERAALAWMPVPEIQRVFHQGRIVGADVKHDGITRVGSIPAAAV